MEDANKTIEANTKHSPKQNPRITDPEISRLENRSSDSSNEDNKQLNNAQLFVTIRKKKSEQHIINEINECLNNGANINVQSTNNKTVLYIAIEKNYKDVVEFLLKQQGIDIDIINKNNRTALDLAKHLNKQEIVQILENYSQDVQSRAIVSSSDSNSASKPIDNEKNTSKKSNLSPSNETTLNSKEKQDTYKKGGTAGIEGSLYQIKLLTLFLYRGIKNSYSFQLATEMEDAGKFDDLVFKYDKADKTKESLYLQAKHRKYESKNISYEDLLTESNGDFSLIKYFFSYQDIKKNKSFGTIKEVILYTNIDLDNDVKHHVENIKREKSDILNLESYSKKNVHYRFKESIVEELKPKLENYKLTKLALELINHILNETPIRIQKGSIFAYYKTILAKAVIDVKNKKFQFYDSFINKTQDLDSKTIEFQEICEQELKKKSDKFRLVVETKIKKLEEIKKRTKAENTEYNKLKELYEYFRNKNEDYKFNLVYLNKYIEILRLKVSNFSKESNDADVVWPQNTVSTNEIKEFLDHLVFAVNQPNEIELGNIIESEINKDSTFKDLSSEFVADYIQKKMLEWFKEIIGDNKGRFLTPDEGQIFLNEIRGKIDSLISLGPSIEYCEQLKEYNIRFGKKIDDLENFLSVENAKDQIFHVITLQDRLLSTIKLYQTIEFQKYNNYLFIELSSLLRPKTQQHFMTAFNTNNYNLLVIVCNIANKNIQDLYNKLSNVIQDNSSKKVILITQRENAFANAFATDSKYTNKYKTWHDSSSFTDLETESQKELLAKKIITFQGEVKKTSFVKLINIDNLHNYLSQTENQDKLNKVINIETLVKFIKNEEINIGHNLPISKGYNKEYYILRKLNQQIILNGEGIQMDKNKLILESDFFVISTTDGELIGDDNKIYVFDATESARSKFTELCEQNTESNIHWLKSDSRKLSWYKSQGSISNLLKYREIDKNDNKISKEDLIDEDKLVHENNQHKIIIISDTAGMGKSTILTNLSLEIKKNNPNLWVIRIDLNYFTSVFYQELEKRDSKKQSFNDQDINKAVNFLLNDLLKLQEQLKLETDLEKELFKYSFNGQGKIALLFDGFDEISPDYQDIVIDLLKAFNKSKIVKLFITTRPNMRKLLEKKLEVFSHELEPFSKDDQLNFFTKFWTKKLELKDFNQQHKERLETYAKYLIERFSSSINDKTQTFIGIPLQTMILAEIFEENNEGTKTEWQGCNDFLKSEQDKTPKLPKNLNVLDLYERFIKRKFYEFHLQDKKGTDFTKSGIKKKIGEDYANFKKRHGILALYRLFSYEDVQKLLFQIEIKKVNIWLKDIKTAENNEGIIDQIIDEKPHFIHLTFADYFACFPIAEKILVAPADTLQCMESMILNTSAIFINGIIDQLDGKQEKISSLLKQPLLLFVIEQNHLNFIKSLLKSDNNFWPRKLDKSGKTPLHYAIEYNHFDFVQKLLDYANDISEKNILKHGSFKKPEYENSNLVKFINVQDTCGKTALNYAIEKNIDLAFELLFKGASINSLTDSNMDSLIKNMLFSHKVLDGNTGTDIYNSGILAVYANQQNKYRPIQEKLLLKAPGIFNTLSRKDQSRILSYFFVHGRIEVIKALLGTINDLEQGNKILRNDDNSYTPLNRVIDSDQLTDNERLIIAQYLWKHGCFSYLDVNSENYITNILQSAAQHGHIKTFEHFIAQENYDNYHNHLYVAVRFNQLNIIKCLLQSYKENIKHDGNNALHYACESGANLKIIKFLIDNGEDIDATNYKGETPLHIANKLNIIEYLITKGAKINEKDVKDNTPLSSAVKRDQVDIIKCLLKKGANISENASQLIQDKVAFFRDQFNLDFNENSLSRLHLAIDSKNFEWVKFLVRQGANINITDGQEKTPLHRLSELQQTHIVELLLQYGAIFDKPDINGRTGRTGDSNRINWLLDVLNKLFSSQNLIQDLNEQLLKSKSGRYKNWGPYGSGIPDAWDGDNPMVFILNARNAKGKTLLHIAADTNDIKAFNILLQFNHDYLEIRLKSQRYLKCKDYQSISFDAIDYQGNTPLHISTQKGNNLMVCMLLEKGVIFNAKNLKGKTPAELATDNNHNDIVKLLKPTEDLFIAIKNSNIIEVKNCISEKAYINIKNDNGETPLHLASSSGQLDIVHLLLQKGAHVAVIDVNKNTPLHVAAENNNTEIVKLLLKYKASYNEKNTQNQTPLDLAPIHNLICNPLKEIDRLFTKIQSDDPQISIHDLDRIRKCCKIDLSTIINAYDNQGNTLLHYAIESNDLNIVKLLLKNGAIFNVKNKLSHLPRKVPLNDNIKALLQRIQTMFKHVDIYENNEIMDKQILINVCNNQGVTLLHRAAQSGKLDVVQLLVEYGANVNAVTLNNITPLYMAVQSGDINVDVVKYLVKQGAKSDIITSNNTTAIDLAHTKKFLKIINLLDKPKKRTLTTVDDREALTQLNSSTSDSSCSN